MQVATLQKLGQIVGLGVARAHEPWAPLQGVRLRPARAVQGSACAIYLVEGWSLP